MEQTYYFRVRQQGFTPDRSRPTLAAIADCHSHPRRHPLAEEVHRSPPHAARLRLQDRAKELHDNDVFFVDKGNVTRAKVHMKPKERCDPVSRPWDRHHHRAGMSSTAHDRPPGSLGDFPKAPARADQPSGLAGHRRARRPRLHQQRSMPRSQPRCSRDRHGKSCSMPTPTVSWRTEDLRDSRRRELPRGAGTFRPIAATRSVTGRGASCARGRSRSLACWRLGGRVQERAHVSSVVSGDRPICASVSPAATSSATIPLRVAASSVSVGATMLEPEYMSLSVD